VKNIYVAIHDTDKDVLLDPMESHFDFLNSKGYGIFKTVNRFEKKRRAEDLKSLDYFYADLDGGDKASHLRIIKKCPAPTSVVETKNGFHVYWKISCDMVSVYGKELAIDYYLFIESLIISCLGADKAAKDVSRILRVPGYLHQKDPSDPFMVREIYSSQTKVKPEHMMCFFRSGYKNLKSNDFKKHKFKSSNEDSKLTFMGEQYVSLWDKIAKENQGKLLSKISGHKIVNGETYSFSKNYNTGKYFIHVDGKRISGAWIDEKGMIGSHCEGGPTVVQWIEYFGRTKREIADFLDGIL